MSLPLVVDPNLIVAILVVVVGLVFAASGWPPLRRLFALTPVVLYVYFLPALLGTLGVLPASSPAYSWLVRHLLPVCLVLLMLSVDLRELLRLGPRTVVMMLAGSLGIVLGGPIGLFLFASWLPPDAWQGLAALSGSWIGGSANLVAVAQSVGTSEVLLGVMIVVDTIVAYGWMVLLLAASGQQARFDRWTRADPALLEGIGARLDAQTAERRPLEVRDLAMILGLGVGGAAVALLVGDRLPTLGSPTIVGHTTWTVMLATAIGLVLAPTRVARLEAAGASRIGAFALYLLLTAIGAQADLTAIAEVPAFLAVGVVWMLVHAAVLVVVAKLTRSPLFFVATSSMANVGGVVSAPVVASVYHRALAPIGVVMGVAGYVIGIYGSLVCAWMLARVAAL